MNCYKVDFDCTNYSKDSVSGDNNSYLDVEAGTLYVMASDLKEVQDKLLPYKTKINSCIKIGKGLK